MKFKPVEMHGRRSNGLRNHYCRNWDGASAAEFFSTSSACD